jgi:hypothetical protein
VERQREVQRLQQLYHQQQPEPRQSIQHLLSQMKRREQDEGKK